MKAPTFMPETLFFDLKRFGGLQLAPTNVPSYCDIEKEIINCLSNKTARFAIQENVYIPVHLTTMSTFNVVGRKLRRRSRDLK